MLSLQHVHIFHFEASVLRGQISVTAKPIMKSANSVHVTYPALWGRHLTAKGSMPLTKGFGWSFSHLDSSTQLDLKRFLCLLNFQVLKENKRDSLKRDYSQPWNGLYTLY